MSKLAGILIERIDMPGNEANIVRSELEWLYKNTSNNWNEQFGRIGSVYMDAANGLSVINPYTGHETFYADPGGNLFVGSNVSAPATTSFLVVSEAQTYNSEALGAGDAMFGDNSSGKANMLWDASAGQLKLRGGTTEQVYIDTDGSVVAGGGNVVLDANGLGLIVGSSVSNGIQWTIGNRSGTLTGLIGQAYSAIGATYILQLESGVSGGAQKGSINLLTYDASGVASSQVLLQGGGPLTITADTTLDLEGTNINANTAILSEGNGNTYGFKAGSSGDVLWYRSGADLWATPDSVDVTGYVYSHNYVRATNYFQADGAVGIYLENATGEIRWNTDTNLYRSSANVLKTDDSLWVAGQLLLSSDTNLYASASNTIRTNDNMFVDGHLHIGYGTGGYASYWYPTASTTVGGEIYTDGTWFRINQNYAVNIYTPRMFRADGGLVSGTVAASAGEIAYTANLQSYKNTSYWGVYAYYPFSSFLTSTTWDGDSYSAAAKASIDMSATFGSSVGFAGIKAYALQVYVRDSGSDSTSARGVVLWHDNTADIGVFVMCNGLLNDAIQRQFVIVPADANGDIYIQKYASGASTLDIWIQVHGMFL